MDIKKSLKSILQFHPEICLTALATTGVGLAFADHYWIAESFFFVFSIWSIGLWLMSDRARVAEIRSKKLPNKKHKMTIEALAAIMLQKRRDYLFFVWGRVAALSFVGLAAIGISEYGEYQWELRQTIGVLTPASDPMPIVADCIQSPPSSAMRVYAAGGVSWSTKEKLTLVQVGGHDLLSVTKEGSKLLVSGDIYTPEGDMVHIDQNQFETQQGLAFKPQRPDKHTLKVFDKWHQEVLSLRFLNAHALRVSGIFWTPGRQIPLVIDDKAMHLGNSTFGHPCNADTDVAITVN